MTKYLQITFKEDSQRLIPDIKMKLTILPDIKTKINNSI